MLLICYAAETYFSSYSVLMTKVESVFSKHHLNSLIAPKSLRFGLCCIIAIKMALFVTEPSVGLLWWEAALEYSVPIFDWPAVTNQGGKKGTMLFLIPSKSHPSSSSATPIFIETPPLQFILHSGTLSLCSIPRGKFFTIPCIVSGSGKQLLDVCFSRYGSSHE